MALFKRDQSRNSEKTESPANKEADKDLLKYLTSISKEDLESIVKMAKGLSDDDQLKDNPSVNKYLSIVEALFRSRSIDNLNTGGTREQRYEIYDEMDETTAYITAALDILSDDATQPDDEGVLIQISSESDKVKSVIENLFTDLEIEDKLSKWARAIAKYGDFFIKVDGEEKKGITSIDDTYYPGMISRKDYKGKLLAFSDNSGVNVNNSEDLLPPWSYVHFRHKGDITRDEQTNGMRGMLLSKEVTSMTSSYGQSVLKPAIKVYAQLRFVENLILLSRLTNSIRRNIFLINVGEVSPAESFETINNYAKLLKKDVKLDLDQGVYNSQKHTVNYDEDIFIPVSDPKNDVRIEQVGGDVNIAEQYDLEYLLNKLFAALKIPKAYLNYEQDLNARSTLIQLDIRYARSVSQLQNTLVSGLMRLARIHLAYMGIDPDHVDLDIHLTNVSSIDMEARLEQKTQKMDAARSMWELLTDMNNALQDARDAETTSSDGSSLGGGDFGGAFDSDTGAMTEPEETGDEEAPAEDDSESSYEPLDSGSSELGEEEPESDVAGEDTKESYKIREAPDDEMQMPIPEPVKSPIDLEYAAEKLFSQYLDFSQEDIDRLLRKPEAQMNESSKSVSLRESSIYKRARRSHNYPDLHAAYPTKDGLSMFENRVRDSKPESLNG